MKYLISVLISIGNRPFVSNLNRKNINDTFDLFCCLLTTNSLEVNEQNESTSTWKALIGDLILGKFLHDSLILVLSFEPWSSYHNFISSKKRVTLY